MSVEFKELSINKVNFLSIKNQLNEGIGYFIDGPYRYVVASMEEYRFDVIRRTKGISFADTIQQLSSNHKVVINGNYFDGDFGLYASAKFGVVSPNEVESVGDVYQRGSRVLPDNGDGGLFFHFGREEE